MAYPPHRMVLNNKKEIVIHELTRVGGWVPSASGPVKEVILKPLPTT